MTILRSIFRLLGVALLLGSLLLGWLMLDFGEFRSQALAVPEEGYVLSVAPGDSLRGLADRLASEGLVSNSHYLVFLGRWTQRARAIRTGEYRLQPGLTPDAFLDQLVAGKSIQYALTLVEGWGFAQLLTAVRTSSELKHTLGESPPAEIMKRIGHGGEHPEGRFFPDTYNFPRGTTDVAFLQRAYDAMSEHLEREWQGREPGLPLKDAYEALTLASIVEKETGAAVERPEIAGVFVRRLRLGMKLQTDPTVIYGLGDGFDGNLRRRDLTSDTPYNTYTRTGLPPTPIAMPGLAAIRAAVHPADGKTLYFVAKGDGTHYFSETLDEHNRAVRKYQLRRK
ncbi:MAG: endolytic transglycosylase MltG [Chromatiales bacterium]|nr:endolytic transglycosylase MltG [Chromatiales bacterium]